MTRLRPAHITLAWIVGTLAPRVGLAQNQLWLDQFGSLGIDQATGVASDGAGGVFLSGSTYGGLNGPNAGLSDAWFARYDGATGNQLWIRQLGASTCDRAFDVAPDGSGGAYITGDTHGSLGGTFGSGVDLWLARYDSVGNQLWVRQASSIGGGSVDAAYAAASDGSGGVYVTGFTSGSLGGPIASQADALVARYDAAGNPLWTRQFGAGGGRTESWAAAPDGSGGVYIGGFTQTSLAAPHAGDDDIWLAHYDAAGNQLWVRQLGSSSLDMLMTAAPDATGGVYVGGFTWGDLAAANAAPGDVWLARYDASGNQLWIRQFGTNASESINGVAPDGSGGVFVS